MELSQVLSKFILFIRLLIFISSIYIFNEIPNHNTTQNFASCTKTGLIAALPTVSYLSVSFSSKLRLFQERQLLQISRECNCSKVFQSITLDTVSQPTLTLLPISDAQHSLKLTHTYLQAIYTFEGIFALLWLPFPFPPAFSSWCIRSVCWRIRAFGVSTAFNTNGIILKTSKII